MMKRFTQRWALAIVVLGAGAGFIAPAKAFCQDCRAGACEISCTGGCACIAWGPDNIWCECQPCIEG